MKQIFAIVGMIAALSSYAHADVCGIVTQDQAEKAISILTPGAKLTMTFNQYQDFTVSKVIVSKANTLQGVQYYDLIVQNSVGAVTQLDPGHTNITLNKNVSLNLGRLVGCGDASDPNFIVGTPIAP